LERVKQHCDQLLTEILEVVQSIRNAARDAREVASIGARPGIETMRVALAICASGGTRRRPVTEIVDEALSQELAPQLDRLSVGMLDSIRQAWEGRYPRFARRIREIVVGRAWS
jgi:hypothetical protein